MSDYVTKTELNKALEKQSDRLEKKLEKMMDKKIDKAVTDLSNVIQGFAMQVDERFNRLEEQVRLTREDIDRINRRLDSIEKQLEISNDERLVMAHQLARLQKWAEEAAERIGVKLPT